MMGKSNLCRLQGEGAATASAFSVRTGERTSRSRPEKSPGRWKRADELEFFPDAWQVSRSAVLALKGESGFKTGSGFKTYKGGTAGTALVPDFYVRREFYFYTQTRL